MTERRDPRRPRLHPDAVRLVARLIREGRAGPRPYGIPLEEWQQALKELQAVSRE